ncbi:MAG: hypothetical protein WA160_05790 [Pseudobdellovibrio sp.]
MNKFIKFGFYNVTSALGLALVVLVFQNCSKSKFDSASLANSPSTFLSTSTSGELIVSNSNNPAAGTQVLRQTGPKSSMPTTLPPVSFTEQTTLGFTDKIAPHLGGPFPFAFQESERFIYSEKIVISGLTTDKAVVSIQEHQILDCCVLYAGFSINGARLNNGKGTLKQIVRNGDTLQLGIAPSQFFNTKLSITVSIENFKSQRWSVTTLDNPGTIPSIAGKSLGSAQTKVGTMAYSKIEIISGLGQGVSVPVSFRPIPGLEVGINGKWIKNTGLYAYESVTNGDSIQLRYTPTIAGSLTRVILEWPTVGAQKTNYISSDFVFYAD